MNKSITAIVIFSLLIIFTGDLFSQKFRVSQVDTQDFPTLRVNFEALDKDGNVFQDLEVNDFIVWDGTIVPASKVTLDCKDTSIQRPVLVCLVLDQSQSMIEDNGNGAPWNWVTYAVKEFLNTLDMSNGSKVSILTFAFVSYYKCQFTDNKQEILESLNTIEAGGGTDYNLPFLDLAGKTVQNLFINEDPNMEKRRLVIFLSDGAPTPERIVKTDAIIDTLQKHGITLYGIIINEDVPQSLTTIAESTRTDNTQKMTFTARSKEDLKEIYKQIVLDVDPLKICSLLWETDFRCQFDRIAQITLKEKDDRPQMISPVLYYVAPIKEVTLSESSIDFGNPQPGESVTVDLILTADYPEFNCTTYYITNSGRFRVIDWDLDQDGIQTFSKFTIPEGESRTIRLQFTQGIYQELHNGELTIYGSPCQINVPLVGGIPALKIIYPNGGEKLSKCSTIPISWTGVSPNIPVKLYYGNEDNWIPIVYAALGLKYNWTPPEEGQFKIRGEISGDDYYVSCAQNAGSEGDDSGKSLCLSDDGKYAFVTGYFVDHAKFGIDNQIMQYAERRKREIFIARYNTEDCTLSDVKSFGGKGMDSANAIVYVPNPNGNGEPYLFITGSCEQGAEFNFYEPDMNFKDKSYFFIAKVKASNLSVEHVDIYGPSYSQSIFDAWGVSIGYDRYRNDIIVSLQAHYDNESNPRPLKFRYNASTMVRNQYGWGNPSSSAIAYDNAGNKYECGTFFNSILFHDVSLNSNGENDIFFNKWKTIPDVPQSNDESDNLFSIDSSIVTLSSNSVHMGDEIVGELKTQTFEDLICNNNSIPMEIFEIVSSTPDEIFVTKIEPILLEPGECADVEIAFRPNEIGSHRATFTILASCARPTKLTVYGRGICGAITDSLIDFGSIAIGKIETKSIDVIFENLNPFELKNFDMKILGTNADEFRIVSEIPNIVEKYGIVSAEIEFKPTIEGDKDAYIQYYLPTFCDIEPVTLLIANASPIELEVNDIDFGLQRVLVPKDKVLTIKNGSEKSVHIDNIEFLENEDNVFEIIDFVPFDIDAGNEQNVSVRFLPLEEKIYSAKIKTSFNSIAVKETDVSGTGYSPILEKNFVCGEPVIPGESSIGTLTLKNLSEYGPLEISTAVFTNNNEYFWLGDTPEDYTFTAQEEKQYPILFKPDGLGIRSCASEITANTKLTSDIDEINEIHTIELGCESLGIIYPEEVDFGNVLACEEITKEIILINFNGETPVTITDFLLSGSDTDYFSLILPEILVFNPGDTLKFHIVFSPDEAREYNAILEISNSISFNINLWS